MEVQLVVLKPWLMEVPKEVVWDPVKNPWNEVKNAVVQILVRNCLDGKK
jgi:hypothetical protein